MKKDYKLRIFIYGKNAMNDIKYLCKSINTNFAQDNKYYIKPFVAKDNESNWEYFIFDGEITKEKNETIKFYLQSHLENEIMTKANDEIKNLVSNHSNDKNNDKLNELIADVLLKYRNFYDIILILVDNLMDNDSKLAFNFFQGFSDKRSQQPFILFLTKKEDNPNVLNLFKLVNNEFFDKRNVSSQKFPTNDDELDKIQKYFIKCMNYYHEIGNSGIINRSQTFNILICGPAGVGKSSFINQFLQEKIAKEGEGLSVTHEITSYFHPIYPIRIFDTPGFEDDFTVQMVQKTIEKFEQDIKDSKNRFDLIIYFSQLKERSLLGSEINLLKHLISQKKKMLFVLNDHGKNSLKQRNRLKEIFKDSLEQVIKSMPSDGSYKNIFNNIIVINLRQSIEEEEDEENQEKINIKIKQTYGMDLIFKKIYDMFVEHKISIYEIEIAKDVKEMKERIQKYELLSNIQRIEDLFINMKIDSSKLILSYAKYDCFIIFFRDKRRKELLQEINNLNKGDKISNIDDFYYQIEKEIRSNTNKSGLVKEFFSSIERFKGVFQTSGFNFDAYWYNEYTLLVGYTLLKKFEQESGQYDEKSKHFLRELCSSLNDAIDGFLELSKEWTNTYKSLKDHKSDKIWINKYFIVEIPKA